LAYTTYEAGDRLRTAAPKINENNTIIIKNREALLGHLVEALCYKLEGRGFG